MFSNNNRKVYLENIEQENRLENVIKHQKEKHRIDVVVIGHFSIDKNIWPTGRIENALGGAPTYAGSTLTKLGKQVGIFSGIGNDYYSKALSYCKATKIDSKGIYASRNKTMTFQNLYDAQGNRKQICEHILPKLPSERLPQEYLESKAFYISPLTGEVDIRLMRKIHRKSVLMLDPQGLMRKIEENGVIKTSFDRDTLMEIFALADIVKIGKEEIAAFRMEENKILDMLQNTGVKVAIITKGKDPVKILCSSNVIEIPTLNVQVEDPTGAGDVFGAAFLSQYLDSANVQKAARFATVVAALKIRFIGPKGFPSKKVVMKYL